MNPKTPKDVPWKPFQTLQENGSAFFDRAITEDPASFQCKKGCQRCCFVSFSIFTGEAAQIRDWFTSQEDSVKETLLEAWQKNRVAPHCVFLVEGSCSVYAVRPLICRTQGLMLRTKSEEEGHFQASCCPLNYVGREALPSHVLDLDRLNVLASVSQKYYISQTKSENSCSEERVSLSQLADTLS